MSTKEKVAVKRRLATRTFPLGTKPANRTQKLESDHFPTEFGDEDLSDKDLSDKDFSNEDFSNEDFSNEDFSNEEFSDSISL